MWLFSESFSEPFSGPSQFDGGGLPGACRKKERKTMQAEKKLLTSIKEEGPLGKFTSLSLTFSQVV